MTITVITVTPATHHHNAMWGSRESTGIGNRTLGSGPRAIDTISCQGSAKWLTGCGIRELVEFQLELLRLLENQTAKAHVLQIKRPRITRI